MSIRDQQMEQMRTRPGLIAALDQSGGSIATTLAAYGLAIDPGVTGPTDGGTGVESLDEATMDAIHAMRSRVITSGRFNRDRVVAAIIFPATMDRTIEGLPSAHYLWDRKGIVPFIRCDQGLEPERDGAQRLRSIPGLPQLLERSKAAGIFGTKMRSVVRAVTETSVGSIVDQQFALGAEILAAGLVPILEPEVAIDCPNKQEAEEQLLQQLMMRLDGLTDQRVMFKLTLPEVADLYRPVVEHPNTLRVVALSGGYSRTEANRRLAENSGVSASFSRALTADLRLGQSAEEFDACLEEALASIFAASIA